MEWPVKLRHARSAMDSMAWLSDVVCSLLLCLFDVYSFKCERQMNLWSLRAYLYTGLPQLRPLCHWLVGRVGRHGLLAQKGPFLEQSVERHRERESSEEKRLSDRKYVVCGFSHRHLFS
jgi:hypothetical protein